jgi:S-formylglutathione hydrolase FrmB
MLLMEKAPIVRLLLFASIFLALFIPACHRPPWPLLDHPRLAPGVNMQDVTFFSTALNRETTYRVFLPRMLPTDQKFPVLYLIHGQGDNFTSWSNNTDVAHYVAPEGSTGLILVMPDCASSYCMNSATRPQDKYEDFMVHDLIADVESRFPAAPNRDNRAIIGISMGGFAAVKLALSHPDLFVFAGSLSGALDVPSRRFSFRQIGQWWRFRGIFGPSGSKTRLSSDPFQLIQTADPRPTPHLYLTVGENEPLLEPNQRFAERARALHFSSEFHTVSGTHTWTTWNSQIPDCFQSLLQYLKPAH